MPAVVLERVAHRIAPYSPLHNQAAEIGRKLFAAYWRVPGRKNHAQGVALEVTAYQSGEVHPGG
jgi:hypothetical protein